MSRDRRMWRFLFIVTVIFVLALCWQILKSGGAFMPRVSNLESNLSDASKQVINIEKNIKDLDSAFEIHQLVIEKLLQDDEKILSLLLNHSHKEPPDHSHRGMYGGVAK